MTAVEEFWKAVQDVLPPSSVGYETATKLGIAYEQAKEMEKEQIDNAWDRGYKQGYYDPEFENETFKSE